MTPARDGLGTFRFVPIFARDAKSNFTQDDHDEQSLPHVF
jgi:hypothetical protein